MGASSLPGFGPGYPQTRDLCASYAADAEVVLSGKRRILVAVAALLICSAPAQAATDYSVKASSPSAHFTSATVRGSVVLRLVGVSGRNVRLTLGGRTIARLQREPYRVSFSRVKTTRKHVRKTLVARDLRSGRALATVRIIWSRTRPSVAITAAPSGTTTSTTANVSFSTNGVGQVTCSLDGATPRSCSSPLSYAQLTSGAHKVVIRNTYAGRTATATAAWTIADAPTVVLTSAPPASTTDTSASVAFTTTSATSVTCSLDAATPSPCTSPLALAGLTAAAHTLVVRATNAGGSAQASASWTVNPLVTIPGPVLTPPPPTTTPPPPAASSGPAAPNPPATYGVPAGATTVSTSAQLLTALGSNTPTDIVLADGVYDNATPFSDAGDHRIYAAHLGGAILRAGIILGGNFGPGGGLIRGIAFDVSDPNKTFEGGIVQTWGQSGRNSRILDSTFDGHNVVQSGILARQVEGLVVQRVVLQNFQSYGLFEDENASGITIAAPALLEDVTVSNVSRPTPKSSNGTAEACIWLGNTATLRRARVTNCAWEGLWTGTAFSGGLVTDLTADATPVGLYLEHFTTGATFQNMRIGGNVSIGVVCEWADPSWGSRPGCNGDTIQNSTFDTQRAGVYLDEGTIGVQVTGCRFQHQAWAGIGDYLGNGNTFSGNDFTGVGSTAVSVSKNHI